MLRSMSEILAVLWHICPKTQSSTRLTKLSIPKPVPYTLYEIILRTSSCLFIGHSVFSLLPHCVENVSFSVSGPKEDNMDSLVFLSKLKRKLCSCSNCSYCSRQPALPLKNSSDTNLKISTALFVVLLLLPDFHPNSSHLPKFVT